MSETVTIKSEDTCAGTQKPACSVTTQEWSTATSVLRVGESKKDDPHSTNNPR